MSRAPRHQLPNHQAARVHIDPQERVARKIDRSLQHLRRHVAPGAHLTVRIAARLARLEYQCQPKVRNARGHVALQQHVLALEVAMRHRRLHRLRFGGRQLLVQVAEAARHRFGNAAQLRPRDRVALQIVAQRSELVVRGDQPENRGRLLLDEMLDHLLHLQLLLALLLLLGGALLAADELEDVGMAHVRQLEDFLLGLPGVLVGERKDFDGDLGCVMKDGNRMDYNEGFSVKTKNGLHILVDRLSIIVANSHLIARGDIIRLHACINKINQLSPYMKSFS